MRVNVGCGTTPIPGWLNLDNSLSVRLARLPIPQFLIPGNGSMTATFIRVAREENIMWADAAKHLPLPDNSVEVLYSSHMVEHLDKNEVKGFLAEAKRVLQTGGIIRLVLPDVKKPISKYLQTGDADKLVEETLLAVDKPRKLSEKIKFVLVGPRNHLWMYDGTSATKLLSAAGFSNPEVLQPGQTRITDPGPLDLFEREEESVYLEAFKL